VVRVVPTPVLRSLVVVVEHPLSAFKVLTEHGLLLLISLRSVNVEIYFSFVVKPLSSVSVLRVSRSEVLHEIVVVPLDLLLTARENLTFLFKAFTNSAATSRRKSLQLTRGWGAHIFG